MTYMTYTEYNNNFTKQSNVLINFHILNKSYKYNFPKNLIMACISRKIGVCMLNKTAIIILKEYLHREYI